MNPMPHQATGLGGQLRGLFVGLALVSSSLPGAPGRSGPLNTWLDLPEWLDLSIDYTSEPMTGITGGANPSAASWYQTVVLDLSMSSGFAKNRKDWNELDHWQLNLQLTNNAGDPNLNSELGAAFALQTLANPVGTWITEVSMIRNQGESWWQAELGLLSLSPVSPGEPGFLSAPAMNSYISSVLNNTFNLLIVGVPINPFVAPGVKLQASSESLGSLEYGYFYLNPQKNIASSLGVDPGIPDVEGGVQALQWKSNPLLSRTDLKEDIIIPKSKKNIARQLPQPEVQIGGYLSSTRLLIDNGSDLGEGTNRGIYGSFTWPMDVAIGLDNRLWAAGTVSFDPGNNPYPSFVGGGWLSQGIIPGRPLDVLAFGFGRTSFSPTINPGLDYEGMVELNYSFYLSDELQIQPVMQWIINPGGKGQSQGIWAGGIQINLNL